MVPSLILDRIVISSHDEYSYFPLKNTTHKALNEPQFFQQKLYATK